MPATVIIERYTGASGSPTRTDITGINTVANAVDSHQLVVGTSTNPIQIPATGGPNYSYWVSTRLNITVAPAGSISNVKWYTDGTNNLGTGVGCRAAASNLYGQATGTPGVTGLSMSAPSSPIAASLVGLQNAFLYTAASSLTVFASTASSTGAFGSFVVYQMDVATTASPGPTPQETFTFTYDET